MKKIFSLLAVICIVIAASSCQKDSLFENDSEGLVFTASIGNSLETKTTITSERKVNWESGDKISINGVEYTATPKDDNTKADFTKVSGDDPASPYKAYYPSCLYNNGTPTLPAVQTYVAGKFNAPMYAESTTTSLSFKNICGVLKITVDNGTTVKSLKVSSDLAMNGAFSIDNNAVKMSKTSGLTVADKTVTLDCGAGVVGTDFYVAIPAGTYTGKNLKVTVTDSANKEQVMTTDQSAAITIAASTLYAFNFSPSIDDSIINPNEYLIYHPNTTSYWKGDDYYKYCSYVPVPPTGAIWEIKMKLPEGTGDVSAFCSSNRSKDDFSHLTIARTYLSYCDGGDNSYIVRYSDISSNINGTGILVIRLLQSGSSINGYSVNIPFNGLKGAQCMFSDYFRERDEGLWLGYSGLPDATRIYYVKVWDSSGNLIYVGHPKQEKKSSRIAWHDVRLSGENYYYADDELPTGASYSDFGMGSDK